MSTTRYASVLGLGYGDCGKGHFINALTRRWQAHTVVRFNGGAQAGHNVNEPAQNGRPARHHTFSQFGAGTLVPGVRTLLVDPMIVHPTALLVEAEALARIGVQDALAHLTIDGQCRITTPFHQAAGRLRELLRGSAAHGTCGVGVGETVRHALEHPGQELRYGDLSPAATSDARKQLDRLQAIRETLLSEFLPQCPKGSVGALSTELQTLQDETLATRWMASARALARHCPPTSFEAIRNQLRQVGCVLFEGAQGVLLDEWRGFHPHTTWSSVSTTVVDGVAARLGISGPIEHYGVLRTYLTRHGAGPLPTHDESLDELLPEPHNCDEGWQGQFRRGHPDAVLLRYALEAAGNLSGLLVSHLDVFRRGLSLKWCESYRTASPLSQWPSFVKRLPLSSRQDLAHQLALTQLLHDACPQYDPAQILSASAFFDRLASVTSLPVALHSDGPTCADVHEM
jgi:adenylosuccinate synthase